MDTKVSMQETHFWKYCIGGISLPNKREAHSLLDTSPNHTKHFSLSQVSKDSTMKLSLPLLICAATASVAMAQLEEVHAGKCGTPREAWESLTAQEQADQVTFQDFVLFCGVQGSCMNGEVGCCRYANGQALECDLENKFIYALVSIHLIIVSFLAVARRTDSAVHSSITHP
jgi:hypothetical protein